MPALKTTTTIRKPHTFIASVAFQLAMDTFLTTYREILEIQKIITSTFGLPLAAFAFSPKNEEILSQLYKSLETLVSSSFYSCQKPLHGTIGQLRRDCRQLFQSDSSEIPAALYKLADKAWIEAHQALQAYVHGAQDNQTRLPFLGHIIKLVKTFERFGKTWPKIMSTIGRDENVLFFLVRRHQDIDAVSGKSFVRNLLKKLFPKSKESACTVVIEGYAKRGFFQLIPSIHSAFKELDPW